jgi:hypothetical protein
VAHEPKYTYQITHLISSHHLTIASRTTAFLLFLQVERAHPRMRVVGPVLVLVLVLGFVSGVTARPDAEIVAGGMYEIDSACKGDEDAGPQVRLCMGLGLSG